MLPIRKSCCSDEFRRPSHAALTMSDCIRAPASSPALPSLVDHERNLALTRRNPGVNGNELSVWALSIWCWQVSEADVTYLSIDP